MIVLSGPIGAGKTTVAREFIKRARGELAYVEGDTFWSHIAKSKRPRHKDFRTIMGAMTAASVAYAAAGFDVLLDFSIPPWFTDTVCKLAKLRDIPVDYVVLCPSHAVCAMRAAKRAEGAIRDYTPYRELYDELAEVPTAIKDDVAEPTALAAKIRDGLAREVFRIA